MLAFLPLAMPLKGVPDGDDNIVDKKMKYNGKKDHLMQTFPSQVVICVLSHLCKKY